MRYLKILAAAAVVLPLGAVMADQPVPPPVPNTAEIAALSARGAQVWTETCAACHENGVGRAPNRGFLTQTRSPEYVYRALTVGVMKDITAGVSLADKKAVATYLIGTPPGGSAEIDFNANRCKRPGPAMTLQGSTWNGWSGVGITNARYQPNPGFTADQLPRLKVKWAFALPGAVSNEPTIVGGRIFISSMLGVTYALDAKTGCTYWSKDLGVSMRTMIPIGKLPSGRFAAYLTDWHGKVLAVDAVTGKQLWSAVADDHPAVRLTGSPMLYAGRLYVPVSSGEEGMANDPKYPCCTSRGSLVAYNAATGKRLWKSYTIEQPPVPLPGRPGRFGPSGASLWMSPTIDAKRGIIYVASGNNFSDPKTDTSDAIIALDLATGAKRWVRQTQAGDIFVSGCSPDERTVNCPEGEVGPDFDFGGGPVLIPRAGKDLLVAVSKGGVAFGFDPDAKGKILWENKIGRGGVIGGMEFGVATDGKLVYAPMSDVYYPGESATSFPRRPGLNAIDPVTGKLVWFVPAPVVPCSWTGPCAQAYEGAAAMIPGAVFASSLDGHIRAYAADTGKQLWDYDTGRAFPAVNGATAIGGSINHGAQSIGAGMLYVTSGGRHGQPGNLMLAFSIDGK